MAIEQLRVPAMSGTHCIETITRAVRAVPGVHTVRVDLGDRSVRVNHDGTTTISALVTAVQRAGYADVSVLA